jgi:integrase
MLVPVPDSESALLVPTILPADCSPALVYLARLSPGSRPSMTSALESMARALSGGHLGYANLPWAALRYQHAQALRSTLAARLAPRTVNRFIAALRGVVQEAWRLGLIDGPDRDRIDDVSGVRVETQPAGRFLPPADFAALLEAAGPRDAAILALGYGAGLRRAEIVDLRLEDVELATGRLTVRGKGGKTRVCFVPPAALPLLVTWSRVRLPGAGPFLTVCRRGRAVAGGLSPSAVLDALRRLGRRSGVAEFTAHDLRRSFVSDMLDAGADLATVQKLVGHSDPRTTSAYDRRGDRAKQAGIARHPFPSPP